MWRKMNKYLKLIEECPNLYKVPEGYRFVFDVGEGWYDLIAELSHKLEVMIVEYMKEEPEDEFIPRAVQVKEKFGGLRFYMSTYLEDMSELIDEAEDKSYEICEICGDVGKVIAKQGWIRTRCMTCK